MPRCRFQFGCWTEMHIGCMFCSLWCACAHTHTATDVCVSVQSSRRLNALLLHSAIAEHLAHRRAEISLTHTLLQLWISPSLSCCLCNGATLSSSHLNVSFLCRLPTIRRSLRSLSLSLSLPGLALISHHRLSIKGVEEVGSPTSHTSPIPSSSSNVGKVQRLTVAFKRLVFNFPAALLRPGPPLSPLRCYRDGWSLDWLGDDPGSHIWGSICLPERGWKKSLALIHWLKTSRWIVLVARRSLGLNPGQTECLCMFSPICAWAFCRHSSLLPSSKT